MKTSANAWAPFGWLILISVWGLGWAYFTGPIVFKITVFSVGLVWLFIGGLYSVTK